MSALNVAAAFTGGNSGLSIWLKADGVYQANVKRAGGGFSVAHGNSPQEALAGALDQGAHLKSDDIDDLL